MKVLDVFGMGSWNGVEEPWQLGRLRLRPEWWPCPEVSGAPMQ